MMVKVNIRNKDYMFLIACFGLAVLAVISFLHSKIGVSYLIFISVFYSIVFLRYRLSFNHRRIGLLFMIAIWILSGSYLFYDNELLHNLNLIMIPILVFAHLVLITSPNTFKWNTPGFISSLVIKLRDALHYIIAFCNEALKKVFKNTSKETIGVIKKVLLGLIISAPLLLFITGLLMSADAVFEKVMLRLPGIFLQLNVIEIAFRFLFILIVAFMFFGIFQVLQKETKKTFSDNPKIKRESGIDSITAITILALMNGIYLLFVVIQFKYFFSNGLITGMTYAEYARRGFFELIIILLINWTILIGFLKLVKETTEVPKLIMKILNSLLIVMSAVMLFSAYQRLSLYESAYGFTVARLIAHGFMLFLIVIFAYTLIRVWIERISLLHFYLIIGLIFYTVLNVINIEQLIVDKNIERYEATEKIDIYYLNSLSYTAWSGLIELYEIEPDFKELKEVLIERQGLIENEPTDSWQSFNFAKNTIVEQLGQLDLKEGSQ